MHARSHRILLVDDQPETVDELGDLLSQDGHTVIAERGPDRILKQLARDQASILVTNIRMLHGLEGIELTRVVKARWPTLPGYCL
jgi:DNA-binding NtrC family response regulator